MGAVPRVTVCIVVGFLTVLAPMAVAEPGFGLHANSMSRFVLMTDSPRSSEGSTEWLSPRSVLRGLVRTNGAFAFAYSPSFVDTVSSVMDHATWFNLGSPIALAADHNGSADRPSFERGFDRGAAMVPLPTNAYVQQGMTLYSFPSFDSAPPNARVNSYCNTGVFGRATPPNGVYISRMQMNPIGIYVVGGLSQCRIWADVVAGRQWYRLQQGGRTWTILVAGRGSQARVTVWHGDDTSGSPAEAYLSNSDGNFLGALYVDGAIDDLRGPGRVNGSPAPAVAAGMHLMVVAHDDIVIQGDITCADFDSGDAVLGIMSGTGRVRIGRLAPNNCHLDAFVMATGPNGEFTVDDFDLGGPRGVFHLRGGCVSRFFGDFGTSSSPLDSLRSGYSREFVHDDRQLLPPLFPTFVNWLARGEHVPVELLTPELVAISTDRTRGELECRYALSHGGRVRIELLDADGRIVASLVDADRPAGEGIVRWHRGRGLSAALWPGVYTVRMQAQGRTSVARVVFRD